MADEPIQRRGARVLVVDSDERLLMLRGGDPAHPGPRYWFTVGGGVDAGETDAQGAVRELFEETGLRAAAEELVGPVHHEVAEFCFDGRSYRQEQVFFLLRVSAWDIDTTGFDAIERATIDAHKWWSAEDLRATTETCYPDGLADLLTRAVRDATV